MKILDKFLICEITDSATEPNEAMETTPIKHKKSKLSIATQIYE